MTWQALLEDTKSCVLPWVGGHVTDGQRRWRLTAPPDTYGWFHFRLAGRKATVLGPAEPALEVLSHRVTGYLAGGRLVSDGARPPWPRVYLVEPVERFTRVAAGRLYPAGPLIFAGSLLPLGPELEVRRAYEGERTCEGIKNVPPVLRMAFDAACALREQENQERRAYALRRRLEQDTGESRRLLAAVDFRQAVERALALSGARYLDHRQIEENVYVLRFCYIGREFECTCDGRLHVISAGICLTASYGDAQFAPGTKGDTWLTVESLPGVIREADERDVLVQYR